MAASSGYEISIRNRLVKQAAWAYHLQPMSSSPSSNESHFLGRINAEDAFKGFQLGIYPIRLIVWAPTREKAIERMKRALDDTIITDK